MFLLTPIVLFMNRVCHTRGRQGRSLGPLAKGVTLNLNSATPESDRKELWLCCHSDVALKYSAAISGAIPQIHVLWPQCSPVENGCKFSTKLENLKSH